MKNSEIITHLTALKNVKDLKLGGKISLVLAKNKKKLIEAYNTLEEVRLDMCKKVAEKDEKGEPKMNEDRSKYIFLPEVNAKLTKDYEETLEQPSDVVIEKFSVGLIDQFNDLTPIQAEGLLLFTE